MRAILFILPIFIFVFSNPIIAAELYVCPMHPHISGEHGDSCPICGMDLVPKVVEAPTTSNDKIPENALHITPTYVQALGVKTDEVTHHEFGKSVRAFGKISASTRLEQIVSVREKGWIVNLATDAIGDVVEKGDILFTYYSPDVMSAQSDYLIAQRQGRAIGNSNQRLRLVGMDDKAIKLFKKGKKMMEETPFHAPVSGTITMLNVRSGSHVTEGGSVMSIQDFSKVWVNADVPLRYLEFLSIGSSAKIIVPETAKEYKTTIDYIHPITNEKTRTATIRLVLDNVSGDLRPESYVDVVFSGESKSRLAVPSKALLYSAMGAYVIEALGDGYFNPVMVSTGISSGGLTEITGGLSLGQKIVTSGQFMLDAESNLRGGMAAMGHDHGGMDMGDKTESDIVIDRSTMDMGADHE